MNSYHLTISHNLCGATQVKNVFREVAGTAEDAVAQVMAESPLMRSAKVLRAGTPAELAQHRRIRALVLGK